jgi:hypothetical protein
MKEGKERASAASILKVKKRPSLSESRAKNPVLK